jgi:hypothetical protein
MLLLLFFMMTKKILVIAVILSLVIPGYFIFTYPEIFQNAIFYGHEKEGSHNESTQYTNDLELNQEKLQLQKEVVQYEITFHHNDTVNVSLYMYVSYVDTIITSNYFLLSDGVKPIMVPRSRWYVPERKYEIITPRVRISIGKFWLLTMMNNGKGKYRIGSSCNDSGRFDVHSGDTWYLTLAVPTSSVKSGYNVTFKSTYSSMEINQLTRHGNLGFYAANYNQFSGKYYAFKLSILGGCSICNIHKEVTTRNGSIIDFYVAAHRKGSMVVTQPNGEEISDNKKGFMHYWFIGNETGNWKFSFKGWSLYFRIAALLLYIDIDPHCLFYSNTN